MPIREKKRLLTIFLFFIKFSIRRYFGCSRFRGNCMVLTIKKIFKKKPTFQIIKTPTFIQTQKQQRQLQHLHLKIVNTTNKKSSSKFSAQAHLPHLCTFPCFIFLSSFNFAYCRHAEHAFSAWNVIFPARGLQSFLLPRTLNFLFFFCFFNLKLRK